MCGNGRGLPGWSGPILNAQGTCGLTCEATLQRILHRIRIHGLAVMECHARPQMNHQGTVTAETTERAFGPTGVYDLGQNISVVSYVTLWKIVSERTTAPMTIAVLDMQQSWPSNRSSSRYLSRRPDRQLQRLA